MPVTIYCNIEDDCERARFRELQPGIRKAFDQTLKDHEFELELFLVESRKSFSVSTVSKIFDVSEKTIRRMVDEEKLTGFKVRGCLRITAASVERYRRQAILDYQLQKNGL